jgi:hypothetical protein
VKGADWLKIDMHYMPEDFCIGQFRARSDPRGCFLLTHDNPLDVGQYYTFDDVLDFLEKHQDYFKIHKTHIALCFKYGNPCDLSEESANWLALTEDKMDLALNLTIESGIKVEFILDGAATPGGGGEITENNHLCLANRFQPWNGTYVSARDPFLGAISNSKEFGYDRFQLLNQPEGPIWDPAMWLKNVREFKYGKFLNGKYPFLFWEPSDQSILWDVSKVYLEDPDLLNAQGLRFAINIDPIHFEVFTARYSGVGWNIFSELRSQWSIPVYLPSMDTTLVFGANDDSSLDLLQIDAQGTVFSLTRLPSDLMEELQLSALSKFSATRSVTSPWEGEAIVLTNGGSNVLIVSVEACGSSAACRLTLRAQGALPPPCRNLPDMQWNRAKNLWETTCFSLPRKERVDSAFAAQREAGICAKPRPNWAQNPWVAEERAGIKTAGTWQNCPGHIMKEAWWGEQTQTQTQTQTQLQEGCGLVSWYVSATISNVSTALTFRVDTSVSSCWWQSPVDDSFSYSASVRLQTTGQSVVAVVISSRLMTFLGIQEGNDTTQPDVSRELAPIAVGDAPFVSLSDDGNMLAAVVGNAFCRNTHIANTEAFPLVCDRTAVATPFVLGYLVAPVSVFQSLSTVEEAHDELVVASIELPTSCTAKMSVGTYDLGTAAAVTWRHNHIVSSHVGLHDTIADFGSCGRPVPHHGIVIDSWQPAQTDAWK